MNYRITGKKAMEAGLLVAIIATIVSFVLIAGTVQRFLSDADEKQAERTCHDSIALRAAMTIRSGEREIALSPPLCKTIDKKIKGDKEKIMQQFADKMARCWWMFGEGRYEQILDGPRFVEKALGIPKGSNDCFQCYAMSIDQDEIKGGPITAQDLAQYLAENDYKKVKEKKYLEYIQSYGGPGSVSVLSNIEPRNVYSIIFFSKNQKGSGSWWTAKATPILGVGAVVTCAVATAGACLLVATGTGTLAGIPLGKAMVEIFGRRDERDVSIIALDNLKSAEQYGCVNDIAGE